MAAQRSRPRSTSSSRRWSAPTAPQEHRAGEMYPAHHVHLPQLLRPPAFTPAVVLPAPPALLGFHQTRDGPAVPDRAGPRQPADGVGAGNCVTLCDLRVFVGQAATGSATQAADTRSFSS